MCFKELILALEKIENVQFQTLSNNEICISQKLEHGTISVLMTVLQKNDFKILQMYIFYSGYITERQIEAI